MKLPLKLGILLPHACEYYEFEAGQTSRFRMLALVRERKAEKIPADWRGGYNFFPLPNLMDDGREYLAQFGNVTTVDDAFLPKTGRIAALSFEGWLALQQRLAHYFSRFQAQWDQLEREARPTWEQAEADERAPTAIEPPQPGSSSAPAG